jgi:hypothetical protein
LIGCDINGSGGGSSSNNNNPTITDAQAPVISVQPKSATYAQNASPIALTVSATSPDGGTLSYQWYSNTTDSNSGGTALSVGATTETYTPPTDTIGTIYYYVVVTNTNNSVNGNKTESVASNTARIEVATLVNAQAPNITVQPKGAKYNIYDAGVLIAPLSVETEAITDGGTLSYQWYSNTTNSNENGTPLSGENGQAFAPPIDITTIGEYYYYVEINNTNPSVNGAKVSKTTSEAARIAVEGASVYFYDENLDLSGAFNDVYIGSSIDLDANKSAYGVGGWYSGGSTTLEGASVTINQRYTRFYEASSVIEITDQTGLNSIRDGLDGKYILLNDIELKANGAGFEGASGWEPIGDNSTNDANSWFTGIFNGNNHKITGLWIKRTDYIGLFGFISGSGASIKNLGVETDGDKNITGAYYVGGIAGYVYGGSTISNSYATGNVSGTSRVGGIAGYVDNGSTISNSYATGNVSGSWYVGGIVGVVDSGGSISNSYATGNVSGSWYVGGIAGVVGSGSISNSYATGNVSGDDAVGGIAGFLYGGPIIENNAAINPLVTGSSNVNRIVGYYIPSGSPTISNNFALDSMSGGVNGSFSSNETKYHGTDTNDDALKTQATYEALGWDFTTVWKTPSGGGYPILQWQSK